MVDHHVDRPGVEVRQRMKLTGTNRSIGLIILIRQCSPRNAREHCLFVGLNRRRGHPSAWLPGHKARRCSRNGAVLRDQRPMAARSDGASFGNEGRGTRQTITLISHCKSSASINWLRASPLPQAAYGDVPTEGGCRLAHGSQRPTGRRA